MFLFFFLKISQPSNLLRSATVEMTVRMAKMKTDTAMSLVQCYNVLKINFVNTLLNKMELVSVMTGTK